VLFLAVSLAINQAALSKALRSVPVPVLEQALFTAMRRIKSNAAATTTATKIHFKKLGLAIHRVSSPAPFLFRYLGARQGIAARIN
jgi:hypothetical protein